MESDKLKDECGVFGLWSPQSSETTAKVIYYGLWALQHRGQESAGIAVSKDGQINYHKAMGLVSEVFNNEKLASLIGHTGIGHVRYSTTGDSHLVNAQPLVVKFRNKQIALGHNGNLVNAGEIRKELEDQGVIFQTTIDTEVIANLFARNYSFNLEITIRSIMEKVKGAFALVAIVDDKLIGVRDSYGLRPLCFGKKDDTWVIASESCALDTVGATLIRDVLPGEMIVIDSDGLKTVQITNPRRKHSCIFELIYFARPDSIIDGVTANSYRYKTGRILAQESFVQADRIIGVPDSGTPAAIGFSEQSGIPYGVGLIKNRYIGRTFIQPTQELREMGVMIKLNVLKKNVEGKRVVVIDDSIVRGTTSRRIVEMMRNAGAKEVHFRVSSPPVAYPCHFGIDTPNKSELIGSTMDLEAIRKLIGSDTLAFLSVPGMLKATGKGKGYCRACFTGKYPMQVPNVGDKFLFEKNCC